MIWIKDPGAEMAQGQEETDSGSLAYAEIWNSAEDALEPSQFGITI